jgi:hypothetical protein
MKNILYSFESKFNTFCCSLFGHHYTVSKKITLHIKEYKCIHCAKEVTTDANGNLSRLTPEMQDINETLQNLYQKRHRSSQEQVA